MLALAGAQVASAASLALAAAGGGLHADEVRVEDLDVEVRQRRADEVVLVEDGAVLDLVLEVHEDRILHELRLQETLLVDRAVEEALVAQVPEEVGREVLHEEVLAEVAREVRQLVPEQVHALVLNVLVDGRPQLAVEQDQEGVVLLEHLEQNAGVLLAELAVLEAGVRDGLA